MPEEQNQELEENVELSDEELLREEIKVKTLLYEVLSLERLILEERNKIQALLEKQTHSEPRKLKTN
jgi:hypothetical protein